MAKYLFTWELGGGNGHLGRLLPIVEALAQRGHEVVLATREFERTATFFRSVPCHLLQAPVRQNLRKKPFLPAHTFAHVLHNIGFDAKTDLANTMGGWRAIFRYVQPDVTVFDHSPTAILSSLQIDTKRVVIGTGFCCPPDISPFPSWQRLDIADPLVLQQDERRVLSVINEAAGQAMDPLNRVSELYTRVDETILATIPELDQFGVRPEESYWGIWSSHIGDPPQWPKNGKRRALVYLKQGPGLKGSLQYLAEAGVSTLVVGAGIDERIKQRFSNGNLRFSSGLVHLEQAVSECDFAVVNANHGTTARCLLAGKPVFMIPHYLEQQLLASRVEQLRAGIAVKSHSRRTFADAISQLLDTSQYQQSALSLAQKYQSTSEDVCMKRVTDRLEALAT